MATQTITIVVGSAPSAAISFTPAQPSFAAPVPAGTLLGTLSVLPSGWSGTLSISGDGSVFLSGLQLIAATTLNAGSYTVLVTATP